MKTTALKTAISIFGYLLIQSCSTSKSVSQSSETTMDIVCNMKIADKSEAFKWKYKDKTYYFDSNTCKETFKMNPEKFINNTCNTIK
jgi:YHS domain-containing protein